MVVLCQPPPTLHCTNTNEQPCYASIIATFLADFVDVIGLCRSAIADTYPQTRSSLHQPLEFLFTCLPSLVPSLSLSFTSFKDGVVCSCFGTCWWCSWCGTQHGATCYRSEQQWSSDCMEQGTPQGSPCTGDDCMTNTTVCRPPSSLFM